jgi:type III restriction enzyme
MRCASFARWSSWTRGRVYPDFVFAVVKDGDGQRLVALESKGDQLDNRDTAYKAKVLEMLSAAYANHASTTDSALPLENAGPDYEAAVVLFSDMAAKLPRLIQPEKAPDV